MLTVTIKHLGQARTVEAVEVCANQNNSSDDYDELVITRPDNVDERIHQGIAYVMNDKVATIAKYNFDRCGESRPTHYPSIGLAAQS